MSCTTPPLGVDVKPIHQYQSSLSISIPAKLVDTMYHEAALAQRSDSHPIGFTKETVPLEYIQHHYRGNLLNHVKEFLFNYLVVNYLYHAIYEQKLALIEEPRLEKVIMETGQDAVFIFSLTLVPPIQFKPWKTFLFKAPKRKNYKDIDRQVSSFVEEEMVEAQKPTNSITVGDWVCFDICLVDSQHHALLGDYQENLWLKIGDEEADAPLQDVFLGKTIGSDFYSNSECLQEIFSSGIDTQYTFWIKIKDIIPHHFFSFDLFKHHFKLSNKELHSKLIEVFSFRNDISQRRMTAEESLKLLLMKHNVEIPNYVILRQQKKVLDQVRDNPDYLVYKTQPDFNSIVRLLAVKQMREMALIEQIAHHENIAVSHDDIKAYLNLTKRPRMREFIYFYHEPTKQNGQEIPVSTSLLKQSCLREKTLNYIIHHLTKR